MSANWFADAFGAAVSDVRDRVIFQGWFGMAVFERERGQLGWERPDGDAAKRSLLDRLYERDPGLFVDGYQPTQTKERGIDR